MARNQDDHVKNISFLMDRRGNWRLAPAYDMTYAYNPGGLWTGQHQMTVNGKREQIGLSDLLACGNSYGIKKAEIMRIIEEVRKSLGKWRLFAEQAELAESTVEKIEKQFVLTKEL